MADKKKTAINLFPYFVDGEQPSANKFNSIGIQIARNLYVIEKSLGDIWAESEPYSSQVPSAKLSLANSREGEKNARLDGERTLSLNIPSVGRIIGPISKLNPLLLQEGLFDEDGGGSGTYSNFGRIILEKNITNFKTQTLKFADNASNIQITHNNSGNVLNLVSIEDLGNPSNSYHPYTYARQTLNTYELLFPPELDGYLTITYTTTPEYYEGGPNYLGSSANMIPDEAQLANGNDLNISLVNGFYEVLLPTVTNTNKPIFETTSTLLKDENPMQGAQLKLPPVLREMFGGDAFKDPVVFTDPQYQPTTDSLIPEGFIYLKNITTGEIYTDAEYYYMSDSEIKVGNVELDNLNDKFCLLTVGTDITSSIQDLIWKLNTHTHDGEYSEGRVSYTSIIDAFKYSGNSGRFSASTKDGNYLPQYLHRDGYDSNESYLNDRNAMRGDLVFAKEKDTAGNSIANVAGDRVGGVGTSHGIYFGRFDTSGSYIKSKYITQVGSQDLQIWNLRGTEATIPHNVYVRAEDELRLQGDDGFILRNFNNNAAGLVESKGTLTAQSDTMIIVDSPIIQLQDTSGVASPICNALNGLSMGNSIAKNVNSEGGNNGIADYSVGGSKPYYKPSLFSDRAWFVPQVKTVTMHDPHMQFKAYEIGGARVYGNGGGVDYTLGMFRLPLSLTHGPAENVPMTFLSPQNYWQVNSPMTILPLKIDCLIRKRASTGITLGTGDQYPGGGNWGVLGGETYYNGDWYQVNQVSIMSGGTATVRNWKPDDYGMPTHIVGVLETDFVSQRVWYRIFIDADEGDDTINPFGRDHLNSNGEYNLEVVFTLTYLDTIR